MVKEKAIDFGYILDSPCTVSGIESLHVEKQSMVIVIPLNHPFTECETIHLNKLENETLILTEKGCTYRAFLLDKLNKNNIPHNISMELSSVETIKKAVENNWGIGFLPAFTIGKSDNVVAIRYADDELNFYSQLIYKKEKTEQKVFNSFMSLFN
ncbi:LysR family transcriptional regulator substrate-binding protein [Salipaludibacillus sp. HK11]|uniref:LysR family transcriptional regulator substrate-binding protein n=1 Tax=Salipaludibacillus sp. HK11 TaxID=3394320 RepID=UPI0039FC4BF4